MPVDWNSHGIVRWKEEAVKMQQGYYHLFGKQNWREYKPEDYNKLKKNIGFAMFGFPEKEGDENVNGGTGYTDKQFEHINKIFDAIKKSKKKHKDQEKIWVSFLFVIGKAEDDYMRFSVIRSPEHDVTVQQNNNIFIDLSGRVYKHWQHYLDSNTLPDCVICYPKNGIYSARNEVVEVEYGISPAGKLGTKIFKGLDVAGAVINTGASAVRIAAIFNPLLLPLAEATHAASTLIGCYAVGRNVATLVDRCQHQQSIGLYDAQSRNCWLGIAGCLMSLASAYGTKAVNRTVQTGGSVSQTTKFTLKSLAVGSCIVNAVGVTSGLAEIINKIVKKEQITCLDIFQFTSALLFFTDSVISAREAFSLIDSIGNNSTRSVSLDTEPIGNQTCEIVEQNNSCNSISQFVAEWSAPVVGLSTMGKQLFEVNVNWRAGTISVSNYTYNVKVTLHDFWESLKKEMAEVAEKICTALGRKNWSEKFRVQDDQIREVAATVIDERRNLANFVATGMPSQHSQASSGNSDVGTSSPTDNGPMEMSVSYDDEVINILAEFVDRQICTNPEYIPIYMAFICKFVKSQFQEEKSRYEKMYGIVKDKMSVEEFDKMYGISGNPNNHFINEVFRKFKDGEKHGYTLLKLAYESQNACKTTQENHAQSSFDVNGVSFHTFYNQHGLADNGLLSEEQYFELAAKLTGQQTDRDSIHISDCGTTAVMQVNAGEDVVMVQGLLEDGKVSGIAALLHIP